MVEGIIGKISISITIIVENDMTKNIEKMESTIYRVYLSFIFTKNADIHGLRVFPFEFTIMAVATNLDNVCTCREKTGRLIGLRDHGSNLNLSLVERLF